MEIGQKDSHRSLFSIWQEIFHLPKPKRHRFAASANNENQNSLANNRGLLSMGALEGNSSSTSEQRAMTSLSNRFHTVLHSAMSSGQYEKVAQGLNFIPFVNLFHQALKLTWEISEKKFLVGITFFVKWLCTIVFLQGYLRTIYKWRLKTPALKWYVRQFDI